MRPLATPIVLAILLAIGAGCRGGFSVSESVEGRYVCGLGGCRWVEWSERERFDWALAEYDRNIERYEQLERKNVRRLEYDADQKKSVWIGWTDEERRRKRRAEHTRRMDEWNTLHLMASEDEDLVLRLPTIPIGPR